MTELRETRDRIEAIRNRDPETLERVARDSLPPLLRAARAAGLSNDDAYDAVQVIRR